MANVLKKDKQQQVVALGQLGWTLRRIEEATGVRRETASSYLKAAGIAVRPPGKWGRVAPNPANGEGVITDSTAVQPVSTESVITPNPANGEPSLEATLSPQVSTCEPHRDFIQKALEQGRNAMAIYQDLVDDHGFTRRYATVRRFVRKLQKTAPPEARVVIHTAPGEEAQVDYGEGPMVRDAGGRYRRTRLFVLTLGASRKSVRLLTWRSSSAIWAQLHEGAFRRLGGTPRIVVLDNLREGVLKADIYDPILNPLYADVLKYYGVVALPCRVRDPDRKGKVEAAVGHAQKTPLKGLRFETLQAAQEYLDRWEERWADTRIHGTTKRQVSAMFAEEKPHLRPLPVEPFRYYSFGERTVHLDGNVEVDGGYYNAGPGRIGHLVHVQWDALHVRVLDAKTGELVREHVRGRKGSFQIHEEDRPSKTPEKVTALLARATRAGVNIGKLAQEIYRHEPDAGARRILGLLSRAKKHGAPSTDHACGVALEAGAPTYRFVKTYLERHPSPEVVLRQVDPLIRELRQYRDLIERRTQENQ